MKIRVTSLSLVFLTICFSAYALPQPDALPSYLNGITLDGVQILGAKDNSLNREQRDRRDKIRAALEHLSARTIVRVVFDPDTNAGNYVDALDYLHSLKLNGAQKIFVMGELLDSESLFRYRLDCRLPDCTADENAKSKFHDYKARVDSYLSTLSQVDIWEVGNEVNGEWADEGCQFKGKKECKAKDEKVNGKKTDRRIPTGPIFPERTAAKIAYAIEQAHLKGKAVALTLIDQPECTTWSDNTMVEWSNRNLKPQIDKYKIDYLLASYYEDNCESGTTSKVAVESLTDKQKEEARKLSSTQLDAFLRTVYWNRKFTEMSGLFTDVTHVGFGEVGYSSDIKTCHPDVMSFCKDGKRDPVGSKRQLLDRYYGMSITENIKYIGGHFWWTAQEDITYSDFIVVLDSYFNQHK